MKSKEIMTCLFRYHKDGGISITQIADLLRAQFQKLDHAFPGQACHYEHMGKSKGRDAQLRETALGEEHQWLEHVVVLDLESMICGVKLLARQMYSSWLS